MHIGEKRLATGNWTAPKRLPIRFGEAEKKPPREDPKPKRSFLKTIRNLGLMGMMILTGESALSGANKLYRGVSPLPPAQTIPILTPAMKTMAADPIAGKLGYYYLQLVAFQAYSLALTAAMTARKRGITPENLWGEMQQRGFTGKGMKIGILDGMVQSTRHLPEEQVKRFRTEVPDWESRFSDEGTHGTMIGHMVHRALPDSDIVSVSDEFHSFDVLSRSADFFAEARNKPDLLTVANVYKLVRPEEEHWAKSVKIMVDKGVQVINISLGLEQVVRSFVTQELRANRIKYYTTLSPAKRQEMKPYIEGLKRLKEQLTNKSYQDPELKQVHSRWTEALDYAYAKGVPVVIASGNDGASNSTNKNNGLGHISNMAQGAHPALIEVGSADADGVASPFTSEWSNERHPLIAGNGAGDIRFYTPFRSPLWQRMLAPLKDLGYRLMLEHPQGTSFASPDVAITYAMMKQVNPDLTIDQARQIMVESAQEVKLNPAEVRKVLHDAKKQNPNLTEAEQAQALQSAIQRRTGAGLIRRYQSVAEAESLFKKKPD